MFTEGGPPVPSAGKFDRATWAGLLCAVVRESRSGVLTARFGRSWKRLQFILGVPVDYRTDRDDDPIPLALEAADLDARAEHLRSAVADSLEWATGTWTFEEGPDLDPDRVDPALLPEPVALVGLWEGSKQHVSMDEAMPLVTQVQHFSRSADFLDWFPLFEVEEPFDELPAVLAGGGGLDVLYRRLPDRSGNLVKLLWLLHRAALFEGQLGLRVEMGSLLEGLHLDDSQADVEMFIESDSLPQGHDLGIDSLPRGPEPASDPPTPPPRPGRYVHTRVVSDAPPSSAEGVTSPAATPPAPREPEADRGDDRESPRKPTRDPIQVVRRDYKHRMGKDYYRFLSLEPEATSAMIERRARQLAGRWQAAQSSKSLPQDVKELARELATGVQLVYRTLADPARRAEYDRRQAQGQAPVLRPIRGASRFSTPASPRPTRPEVQPLRPGGAPTLKERIKHFVETGEWKLAAGLLQEARLVDPSDPDVLAELGWVTWQLDKDHESAEEFLKLAVAFDADHFAAICYLGKLSIEAGDEEGAAKWLPRVMELDRSQRWARRALRKLEAEQAAFGKQPGLKFWKKGE